MRILFGTISYTLTRKLNKLSVRVRRPTGGVNMSLIRPNDDTKTDTPRGLHVPRHCVLGEEIGPSA